MLKIYLQKIALDYLKPFKLIKLVSSIEVFMVEKKFAILADPSSASWEFAQRIFDSVRLRSDEFTLDGIEVKEFRDGELKPKISDNIRGKVCFFIHS